MQRYLKRTHNIFLSYKNVGEEKKNIQKNPKSMKLQKIRNQHNANKNMFALIHF